MRFSFNPEKRPIAAIKLLHRMLPDLHANLKFLIVPPAEHYLRCFVITDGLISDRFHLWAVVMPLYRPRPFLVANYGRRLLDDETVSLKDCDLNHSIERMKVAILTEGMTFLDDFRTPEDFMRRVDWNNLPQTPNYLRDLAVTHYVAGDVERSRRILDHIVSTAWRPIWGQEVKVVRELASELKENPEMAREKIMAWEGATFRWLELGPRYVRRNPTN
jgi:hypothetical protein